MQVISLFSGIGGFELAAEQMGWENIVSCEINPFGRKVLEYYWPQAYHHDDIKTLTYEKINEELTKRKGSEWRSGDIILTGGFPCQPYSLAGKRLGKNDDRHLWPEMLRIIREVKPTWIVGENVFGIVNWNGGLVFNEVQTDLEAQGYEVQSYVLPACAVNAPHRRDRVWFVAYRKHNGQWNSVIRRNEKEVFEQQGTERFNCRTECIESTQTNGLRRDAPHPTSERLCGNGAAEQSQLEALRTRNGMGENVPRPNGNGLNGGDCEHEVNTSEGGEYAQRDLEQMGRDVADTEGGRSRGLSVKSEKTRTRESNNSFRGVCGVSNAADTGNEQLQGGKFNRSIRIKREIKTNSGQPCRPICGKWEVFPTQSPICTGNNGLSARLDSITFSKWRNESIKAAGNAIVPAVVLQIFKTIEAYNNLTNGE